LLVQGAAIHGVYIDSSEESIRTFMGKSSYDQWLFAVEMLPVPTAAPERPLPRVRSDWIGKPFAEGLAPVAQAASTNVASGQPPAATADRRPPAAGNDSSKRREDQRERLRERLRGSGFGNRGGRGGGDRSRGSSGGASRDRR